MWSKVVFVLSFTLVSASGKTESKITFGKDAIPGQFPHQVAILSDRGEGLSLVCGGTCNFFNFF